ANPISVLLSKNKKALQESKKLYEDIFTREGCLVKEEQDNKSSIFLEKLSKNVYDYFESIQETIIFGYTAIEAFVNISIPFSYRYEINNHKGITEVYSKDLIERWIPLKTKIGEILTDIYKTPKITASKIWDKFLKFEDYRNKIIHLKTNNINAIFNDYFDDGIFEICEVPIEIITFFFTKKAIRNLDPILDWPWIISTANEIPVIQYDAKKWLISGTIHDE
ncbi:MAG: hypothetical protein PHP65_02170, partial [Bacilli bacterium]|nr:hypothetical protein [Bacilli bacterium]